MRLVKSIIFISAIFISATSASAQSITKRLLSCQSYGPNYSKQFSEAAAKSLRDAGYTTFRVKASLKLNGDRPTREVPPDLIPDGLFTVNKITKPCNTNEKNKTVCKGGVELSFAGALPPKFFDCEIPKELTLTVKVDKGLAFTTKQNVIIPGKFVVVLREGSDSSNISR